jgi:hypothetical protein
MIRLRPAPRQALADDGVVGQAPLPGQEDEPIELGLEADGHGRRGLAPLEAEERHGDGPPVVDATHDLVLRARRVGEVDLVELRLARDHPDRSHLDAGLAHVDQQEADALVLRGVGIRPGEEEDVVGQVSRGRPHLLTVDNHWSPSRTPAAGLPRSDPALGSVALAPRSSPEDAGRVVGLLLVGPPHLQGVAELWMPNVVHPRSAPRPWSSRRGSPAPAPTARAAVLLRPAGRQVAVLVEGMAPLADEPLQLLPSSWPMPCQFVGSARRGRPGLFRGRPRPRPSKVGCTDLTLPTGRRHRPVRVGLRQRRPPSVGPPRPPIRGPSAPGGRGRCGRGRS